MPRDVQGLNAVKGNDANVLSDALRHVMVGKMETSHLMLLLRDTLNIKLASDTSPQL